MGFAEVIEFIIEKGITLGLSLLVILFIYQLITNLPKWVEMIANVFKDNAVSTDNNTEVMREVKEVFKDTKDMHVVMDNKMDNIINHINALTDMLEQNKDADDDFRHVVLKQIDKLIADLEEIEKR